MRGTPYWCWNRIFLQKAWTRLAFYNRGKGNRELGWRTKRLGLSWRWSDRNRDQRFCWRWWQLWTPCASPGQNSEAAYPARSKRLLLGTHHWWPRVRWWGAHSLVVWKRLPSFPGSLAHFWSSMVPLHHMHHASIPRLVPGSTNQPQSWTVPLVGIAEEVMALGALLEVESFWLLEQLGVEILPWLSFDSLAFKPIFCKLWV